MSASRGSRSNFLIPAADSSDAPDLNQMEEAEAEDTGPDFPKSIYERGTPVPERRHQHFKEYQQPVSSANLVFTDPQMEEAEAEDTGPDFPESWGIETPLLLGRNEDDEIVGVPPTPHFNVFSDT